MRDGTCDFKKRHALVQKIAGEGLCGRDGLKPLCVDLRWNFRIFGRTIGDGDMLPEDLPILYVKTGCPWCDEARRFLDDHGVSYREQNVTIDANAKQEMQKKSRQTLTPTLDWHGKILADFGVAELVPFLRQQNVKLEDS